jgi:tRNA A-37 threonylcarbamoyl transferase component Bud32
MNASTGMVEASERILFLGRTGWNGKMVKYSFIDPGYGHCKDKIWAIMANVDAVALAEKAMRLGLLKLDQLQEGWEEVGRRDGDPEPLVRALERKGYLTPFQSHKLLKDDPDGYFLGRYRILYKIASGSFGRVYRGDDPTTGTIVAIKVLRRKWSEDKHTIDLFEREGKVGMALRHRNIVEILEVNRDIASRQYYIIMEFVEGGNLRDILARRKKFEPVEAMSFLEEATAGLAHAFSHGISHRDMKLTNILISSQGHAKLVDFGLAGVYGKAQITENATVDRTVDYAGLERATSVPPGDIRSDIYFLGCVTYEMLTGRSPLQVTRDARARMNKERFLLVSPMREDEVTAPPSVYRLVETMMAFSPEHRYQTPSQLLDAVQKVRRELEGKSAGPDAPCTLFVAEKDEKLQDIFRDKFKEQGFRVLLASDPIRAYDRLRQQPFDVLLVDGRTTGEEGILKFEKIMNEADRQRLPCVGILLLDEDQAGWQERMIARPNVAFMIGSVKFKGLLQKVNELLAVRPR